jgi:RimJ/RimL family protein N-acetyltransferase
MPHAIRLLDHRDAVALAEHSLRAMATSGVPPTPKFVPFAFRDLPPQTALVARYEATWAIPVGQPGWNRCFGLVDASGQIRGEAGLRTGTLRAQSHRATMWLGLETAFRGKGQGQALLQALIDWAAAATTLAWIDLGVFAHNTPGRRLYTRLGFVETGRTIDAFRVDDERIDDILMSLDVAQYRWSWT